MQKQKCDLCAQSFPRDELITLPGAGDLLYSPECAEIIRAFFENDSDISDEVNP